MKQLYFYKLDSLRFFAFFLVFWSHSFEISLYPFIDQRWPAWVDRGFREVGSAGVHIFFVLSGFLITFLLIKEYEEIGKINIKKFYLRRVLRIWPLYYLVTISGIFILPHLFHTFEFNGSIIKNLTFLNNFDRLDCPNLAITWSVAIEEQFYLFWPVLFYFFYGRNLLYLVCSIILLVSSWFILVYGDASHFHTLGNINYLMAGGIGAIYYSENKERLPGGIFNRQWPLFMAAVTLVVLQFLSFKYSIITVINVFASPFLYLYFVCYMTAHSNTGKPSVFSKLGKYTYGMYLYHATIIIFGKIAFTKLGLNYDGNVFVNYLLSTLCLLAIIVISIVSYNYFEKFFLQLKNNFAVVKTRL